MTSELDGLRECLWQSNCWLRRCILFEPFFSLFSHSLDGGIDTNRPH